MITITILCVGKIKESFFREAILEYEKRLSKYCSLHIIEVADEKLPLKINTSTKESTKQKECMRLQNHIPKDSYVFCLDLHGKDYSSESFSQKLDTLPLQGNSSITFIIGGTLGLTSEILSIANEKISFSKMTFPHQLMRIFLLEQLFRAFKISKGETYHW